MVERVDGATHAQWNRKWENERQRKHQDHTLKVWILLNIVFFMTGLIIGHSIS